MSLESGKNTATLIAFVFAPLVSTLIYPLMASDLPDDIVNLTVDLLFFYFFCSLATLILGMPIYFLLRHFKLVRWWTCISSGIVIGVVVAVLVSLKNPVQDRSLAFYAGVGAITGFCFWLFRYIGKRYAQPTKTDI